MWIRFISIGSHLVSFICIQIPIFRLGHDEICSLIFSIGKISFTNVPVLHSAQQCYSVANAKRFFLF